MESTTSFFKQPEHHVVHNAELNTYTNPQRLDSKTYMVEKASQHADETVQNVKTAQPAGSPLHDLDAG